LLSRDLLSSFPRSSAKRGALTRSFVPGIRMLALKYPRWMYWLPCSHLYFCNVIVLICWTTRPVDVYPSSREEPTSGTARSNPMGPVDNGCFLVLMHHFAALLSCWQALKDGI
jgi:hypothetical protein